MKKVICFGVSVKDLLYSIPGYACSLYLLFPFRFWKPFVFTNQIETIVVTTFFACTMLLFFLIRCRQAVTIQWSKTDVILLVYGIYLLFRLKYPLENEVFFTAFSAACIYLYFRKFPDKYLSGLLFLLPLAGIVQMIDGINRFTMPWQKLSHITGIFGNTGLFGGFVALGLVVCVGMIFFSDSDRRHSKIIVPAVLIIPLALQMRASGSRASWIAAWAAILFLLYHFVGRKNIRQKIFPNKRWSRYMLVFCLLLLFIPFSIHLYGLKKDSADGRLLIAKVSMGMVREAPVFGCGISGFKAGYMNHQADYFRTNPGSSFRMNADDVETPFNEFLKILIEQGIVGLLLFFCLLYFLFEMKSKGIAAVTLFILIFGLFSYPFDRLPFIVLFVFSIAILSRYRNPVFELPSRKLNGMRIPLLIAFCLVSCKVAVDARRYAESCLAWNSALADFAPNKEESLFLLKNLYPGLKNNPVFLTTYGKALNYSGHYPEARPVLEKAVERLPLSFSHIELGKCYEAAELPRKAFESWKQASLMVPARFTPLYLTMKLHFKNGEYDRARECAEALLAKEIKIDSPEIDKMKKEAMEILNF